MYQSSSYREPALIYRAKSIPHGTCAGVGIGGHATLGGFGLDSRLWGMMLDVVSSVTAVLADGSVVQASASSNKDLFWALRGAGPGFAVITQFKLKTFAAPPVNINFSYTWNTPTPDLAASVYQAAQNWGQQSAPKELGYGIIVSSSKAVVVRGVYYGSRTQYDSIIASMLAKVTAVGGNPAQNSVQNLGWIASLVALAGEALETPQKGYNEHDTFVRPDIRVTLSRFDSDPKIVRKIRRYQGVIASVPHRAEGVV